MQRKLGDGLAGLTVVDRYKVRVLERGNALGATVAKALWIAKNSRIRNFIASKDKASR